MSDLQAENHKKYGQTYRMKFFDFLVFSTSDPKIYELILSNTKKYLKKSKFYDLLRPWLGDGLATSHGRKWHSHRRLLAPQFHVKNLEESVEIFDRQSSIFVEKLQSDCGKDVVDVLPFVTLFTFDVINETAFGIKTNAQNGAETIYVKAIERYNYFIFMELLA